MSEGTQDKAENGEEARPSESTEGSGSAGGKPRNTLFNIKMHISELLCLHNYGGERMHYEEEEEWEEGEEWGRDEDEEDEEYWRIAQ